MPHIYNLQWLTDKFDKGDPIKFLFFWGHANKPNETIGKFCFSQWFKLPFIVENITYQTSEHWMMASKALTFEDLKTYDKIINANSPGAAKALGREVAGFDEHIWNDIKLDIVITGNIHKFNQNKSFAEYLMSTGDRVLVEASPVDKIWGIGLAQNDDHADNPYCWEGQNLLGFALMEVRDFFHEYGFFDNLYNIPSAPWKMYPHIDPMDLFWRMGTGEEIVTSFSKYFFDLPARDKRILELTNPAPNNWRSFYS